MTTNLSKLLLKERRLILIFGITTISVMGVASFMSAYPKIADYFEITPAQVSLISAVFTLPGLLITPILGILADKFGRKRIILPALLLFAFAGFLISFVNDFNLFLLLIFIQGIGAAPLGALNVTLISDFFQGKERATALGYNGTILNLSTTIYPILGGLLAGFGWRYPFLLPLLSFLVFFPILWFLKENKVSNINQKSYFKQLNKNFWNPHIIGIYLTVFFTFFILFGTLISYMPFLIKNLGNNQPFFIGLQVATMSVSAAISSSMLSKWLNFFTQKKLLLIAFLLYSISILGFIIFKNPNLFFISTVIFGIGHGVNIPTLTSILSHSVPKENLAGFMSFLRAFSLLGQTTAPIVFSIFFNKFGMESVFIFGICIGLLSLFSILFLIKNIQLD